MAEYATIGETAILESIITAFITGALTLAGVIYANRKSQAVMEYQIEELTREVRKHNNFAEKIPILNNEIYHIQQDINALKEYHK